MKWLSNLFEEIWYSYFNRKSPKIIDVTPPRYTITIEEVEKLSGVKLTYPNQRVPGDVNEERYKELCSFGCSDIWDDKSSWYHRDCFSRHCDRCTYYPIVEAYNRANNIPKNTETDFVKAMFFIDELDKKS